MRPVNPSESPLTFETASHLLHYLIVIGQSYMLSIGERREYRHETKHNGYHNEMKSGVTFDSESLINYYSSCYYLCVTKKIHLVEISRPKEKVGSKISNIENLTTSSVTLTCLLSTF